MIFGRNLHMAKHADRSLAIGGLGPVLRSLNISGSAASFAGSFYIDLVHLGDLQKGLADSSRNSSTISLQENEHICYNEIEKFQNTSDEVLLYLSINKCDFDRVFGDSRHTLKGRAIESGLTYFGNTFTTDPSKIHHSITYRIRGNY